VHAANARADVISVAVSKASAVPGGFTLGYNPPSTWIAKLAAA
jgi:hypothetical protein